MRAERIRPILCLTLLGCRVTVQTSYHGGRQRRRLFITNWGLLDQIERGGRTRE